MLRQKLKNLDYDQLSDIQQFQLISSPIFQLNGTNQISQYEQFMINNEQMQKTNQDTAFNIKKDPKLNSPYNQSNQECNESMNIINIDLDSAKSSKKQEKIKKSSTVKSCEEVMSLQNQINYKLKKIQPIIKEFYTFRISIKKVQISSFNKLTNQGIMTEINDNTNKNEPKEIIYHRNDFKNKFYIVKLLLLLQIPFNVIIIQDDVRQARMLCLDREFLINIKFMLEKYNINKNDFTNVQIL